MSCADVEAELLLTHSVTVVTLVMATVQQKARRVLRFAYFKSVAV